MHIKKTFYHLGIDETTLGMRGGNLVTLLAQTRDESLIQDHFNSLKKAKDYITQAKGPVKFPSLTELRDNGLDTFYWTRVHGGRFRCRELQHASIAKVVMANGYTPKNIVLHLDAFESRHDRTIYIIKEMLNQQGFAIQSDQIKVWGGGDRSIPIINYADLLAAQIGLTIYDKYKKYGVFKPKFNYVSHEIPFNKNRTKSLSPEERNSFEKIVASWKP